jgi:lysophospholipid acyltransferase (LPLAT)-like uncharacterized protein
MELRAHSPALGRDRIDDGMRMAALTGHSVGLLLQLWRHSVRTEMRGGECFEEHPSAILASWHGRMQGPLFCVAGHGVLTMASQSLDGEVAARAVAHLGLTAARGSTGKGGVRALELLHQWVVEGRARYAGLTVDGPRGPIAKARRGAVDLARRLEVPIIPCSFSARPHWMLRSWDRMVIAPPLSRMVVHFGPVMHVGTDEPASAACARLKALLDEITESLDRELHGRTLWPDLQQYPVEVAG